MEERPVLPITEDERQIYARIVEDQSKRTYFMVAAALSAIAFTVHTTRGETLSWAHLGFGIALALWGVSAAFGMSGISDRVNIKQLNLEAMAVHCGASAMLSRSDQGRLAGISAPVVENAIRERVEFLNKRLGRRLGAQWWLLLAAAGPFFASHIARMSGY